MIEFDDIEEGYPQLVRKVIAEGRVVFPRKQKTHELGPVMFCLTDPSKAVLHSDARKLNHAFCAVEFLWVASGQDESEVIGFYNSRMAAFADRLPLRVGQGPRFFGAYGPPIVEQLPYVVQNLRDDPDSRQAVVTIWRPSPPATKDVPCTVALQFLLRGGRLMLHTMMRSNDLYLGVPYDVPLFCRLQHYVASLLGVEVGRYYHTAGSLHVYERDFESLDPVVKQHHVGLRPDELVVGPFGATAGQPAAAYALAKMAASIGFYADASSLELGWSTLASLAVDYARRKREKATA